MPQGLRGRRLMGEINVVPYIDVMLVLLIIFMITAPLLTQGVKVELPKAAAEPIQPQRIPPLVLSVDRSGRLYLNLGDKPQAPLDEGTVAERATAALARHPDMQVLVKANDYKIDDTIENLRTATENLDQLTESVKQRPWSLVRSKQPEDRKVPK